MYLNSAVLACGMLFVFEGVVVVVPGFKFVFCPGDERFCVVVLGGA